MRPTQLASLIKSLFAAKIMRPLLIRGCPGGGKTDIPQQVADELAIGCTVLHVATMLPEDTGMPIVSQDKTQVDFAVPFHLFPIEGMPGPEFGILVADELPQGDTNSQKFWANLMQAREIRGRRLKPGWLIIATGNKSTDRAGASRLLSHLQNKITTVDLDVSLDDWKLWALANNVPTEVIAFLNFRPAALNAFDAQNEINATPRSWVQGVGAKLGHIDSTLEFEAFQGDVGEAYAAEFCAFLKIFRKLPSPDAILINPTGTDVPTEPATLYALCGALSQKTTPDNFGRVMQYIGRMPAEFGALYVRDTIKAKPAVQNTRDFIAWASGPGAKLLA